MARKSFPKLKRRKDGRFRLRYDGQEFYSSVGGEIAECVAQRDEYIRTRQTGRRSCALTLGEYALAWLPIAKPKVARSTYAEAAILLQHLVDRCGEKPLRDVLPSDIKTVYSTAFADLSDSYIRSARQLYVALFDAAVSDRLIDRNPAREKPAAPHRGTKGKHRAITPLERHWIHTFCTDHRAYPAVMAMLYEGLRPPEAKALDLSSVDRDNNVLHLTRFVHKKDNNHYVITAKGKTERSARDIPLFTPFLDAIGDQREGPLVASADGSELTIRAWTTLWQSYVNQMEQAINGMPRRWYRRTRAHKQIIADAALLRAQGDDAAADEKLKEVPPWIPFTVRPYDLRHSFATLCRDQGIEINTCIRWMGHTDATMILKIYDEVTPARSLQQAEALQKYLNGGQTGGQP